MGLFDKLFGKKKNTEPGLRKVFAEAELKKAENGVVTYELKHPGLMLTFGVAELLFHSFPGKLDAESLKRKLGDDNGNVTVEEHNGVLVVTFKNVSLLIKDQPHPMQVLIEVAAFTPGFDGKGDLEDEIIIDEAAADPLALLMRDAAEEVRSCRKGIRIFEKGAGLPGGLRLALLARVTRAACLALNPSHLYWRSAYRLVDIPEFLRVAEDCDMAELTPLITTLRMGRVANGEEGDCIADTLGLFPFGLPDVQLHFKKLPPDVAGAFVIGTAHKLWSRGLFAHNGESISLEVKRKDLPEDFFVEYQQPLLAPGERVVLALDPGKEFAASKPKEMKEPEKKSEASA
ncbi:MAG: hypothetical protein ACJ790_18880 [Myxococcaceae bacterium]